MKLKEIKYPRYYNVDGVPVVIDVESGELVGKVANSKPHPIGKAIVDGYEVTKSEYSKLAKSLYKNGILNTV